MTRVQPEQVTRVSAAISVGVSLAAGLVFLAVTLAGDYSWVARIGGAAWIFLLGNIILMPVVTPMVRERAGRPQRTAGPALETSREGTGKEAKDMVKDVVCGMEIEPESAVGTEEYEGQAYYFCSRPCEEKFRAEPEKYA